MGSVSFTTFLSMTGVNNQRFKRSVRKDYIHFLDRLYVSISKIIFGKSKKSPDNQNQEEKHWLVLFIVLLFKDVPMS